MDQVTERLRVEREARRRGIDPDTLWQAVEDELAQTIQENEAASKVDEVENLRLRIRGAWRLLNQDWRPRGGDMR